ncbi:MAG: glycosyltransferase [Planctomycetes bacterium]|nr:glycosyltransferase [Planctomycetota bacterium]
MKQNILILSAGVGAGHNSAAAAIHETIGNNFADCIESRWIDVLKLSTKMFKKTYSDSYLTLVNHFPALWGLIYKISRKKFLSKISRAIDKPDSESKKNILNAIDEYSPNIIICTHFMPANLVLKSRCNIPVYIVATDYDAHRLWVNKKAAGYFVSCEQAKWLVSKYGYEDKKIFITGLPVHPKFTKAIDKYDIYKKLGLKPELPAVLLMAGGFGGSFMKKAVQKILSIDKEFQLIIVCGKNESLEKKIKKICGNDQRAIIHGFVDNVQELMTVSRFTITKSGGLSMTEAMVCGSPLLIFKPTPGQEVENCIYALESGFAMYASLTDTLDFKVKMLLENDMLIEKMSSQALNHARPFAANDIIETILKTSVQAITT